MSTIRFWNMELKAGHLPVIKRLKGCALNRRRGRRRRTIRLYKN